jgi:hypothetical protein
VDRPAAADAERADAGHLDGHDRVMEDEEPADRRGPARDVLRVVDFLDLDRRHIAILGQAGLAEAGAAPPIRADRLHAHLGRDDDEIGRADGPALGIRDGERLRQIGGIAARRATVDPRRDLGDVVVAQREVVLVMLDADVLLDVPRRHRALTAADRRAALDRRRVRARVLVGQERHRRQRVGPMAVLTAALQDRRDVFREGDLRSSRADRLPRERDRREQCRAGGDGRGHDERRARRRAEKSS